MIDLPPSHRDTHSALPQSIVRITAKFVAARDDEFAAVLWSFAWFFCVLSAYYVVRPVRETFATVVGRIDHLFLGTFVAMLVVTPIYAAIVDRYDRRVFVPLVYRFFSVCLALFSGVLLLSTGGQRVVGVCFFVWVSVFGLFIVSIFWSVLADTFSSDQAKRLFGFIAAGGTIGGVVSSTLLSVFGNRLTTGVLLVLPILLFELAIYCFCQLEKTAIVRSDRIRDQTAPKTKMGIWSGIVSIVNSPYLLGVCLFLLLGKWCATTIYSELIDVVTKEVSDIESRTQLFARENLAVQILTLAFQLVLTRQILKWCNLPWTLALMPTVLALGFGLFSTRSSLLVMFVLQVVQRSGAYGVIVPAQEVLFTVVSDDEKYKSKNFIDTAVYRGGDAASASLHTMLTHHFTRPSVALIMLPVATIWAALGWFVGRAQVQRALHTSRR